MRRKVISYFIIISSILFTFNLARGVYDSYRNKSKIQDVQEQLTEAKTQNEQLKKDLEYKQSEFFVEKEAREKLNLAKKGEVVAILPGLLSEEKTIRKESKLENWEKWYQLFLQ